MVILSSEESNIPEILERMLDKGVVVDTRVKADLSGVNLLGVRAAVILSSFKIAEKIGLAFPEGTNTNTPAWQVLRSKRPCPICGRESDAKNLKDEGCLWCGWNYRPKEG